ncbi:MAG: B12-binding domain-containing radical SAM protein, partial [Nitrospira sp.]|nr:B12-binding domain-containing radical SAM protein [Nitrospira sp.]
MKVSLLFPPTWHPSQPYLSLPSLTGFLHQGGVSDVSQRDLGIELLDTVLTRSYAAEVHQLLIAKQRELERSQTGETGAGSREHYAKVTDSLDRFSYLVDRIELAKETLRSEGFYDPDAYRASLFMIDKWLEVVSAVYFPTRLTVVDNQFGNYSIYSSKDLMKVVRDEAQNPFLSLFRNRFIPSIVD